MTGQRRWLSSRDVVPFTTLADSAVPRPVRVYILIDSLVRGGAERFTVTLSGFLADRGIETTVVTLYPEDRDFFHVRSGVDRVALDLVAGPGAWSKLAVNVRRVLTMRALLRDGRADVVIGMMTAASVVSLLSRRLTGARVVVAERNFPGRKRVRLSWVLLRKLLYRFADCLVAQTRETAAWLEKHAGGRNVRVIPNPAVWPLPVGEPVLSPDHVLPAGSRCFMAAGTKIDQKGFDLLVEAFASVAGRCADWHLVVVGVSPDDPRQAEAFELLLRRVAQHGLGERVHFPGPVGNISQWYETADVFVLSSRYEGYPNVLLEAMAAGCACIAFDCDTGPRDLVSHEVDGLLATTEDTADLAGHMARLARDPDLRARLGDAATRVRDCLSEARILEQWREMIVELAGDDRQPAGG